MKNLFGPAIQELNDLEGEMLVLGRQLFSDRTSSQQFISVVRELSGKGFDLNGLQNRGWTIGRVGLMKGEPSVVHALDEVGYNFALDSNALDYSRHAWHGSLHAAVAKSAHKYDASIIVPSFEEEATREAAEMRRPSLRGISATFVPPPPGPPGAH